MNWFGILVTFIGIHLCKAPAPNDCNTTIIEITEECSFQYDEESSRRSVSQSFAIQKRLICKAFEVFFHCLSERKKFLTGCHPYIIERFDENIKLSKRRAKTGYACSSAASSPRYVLFAVMPPIVAANILLRLHSIFF